MYTEGDLECMYKRETGRKSPANAFYGAFHCCSLACNQSIVQGYNERVRFLNLSAGEIGS